MKSAPMAIPAMALLQQHKARRDIVIEPEARLRAAIEARGHSELRAFGTGDVRNWGRNRAVKTNWLVSLPLTYVTSTGVEEIVRWRCIVVGHWNVDIQAAAVRLSLT